MDDALKAQASEALNALRRPKSGSVTLCANALFDTLDAAFTFHIC
jgi:hypothetical protein